MTSSTRTDDFQLTTEVVHDFLRGILLDGRYVSTYQDPRSEFKITFRTLTYAEETEVRKQLLKTFEGQEYVDSAIFRRARDFIRLRFCIQSIHFNQQTIYDASIHDVSTLEQRVLVSEPMQIILRTLLQKFDALCSRIIKEVSSNDFFGVFRGSTTS